MKRKTAQRIFEIWDEIDDAHEDISTEQLFVLTVEAARPELGDHIDEAHVAEAVFMMGDCEEIRK